MLFLAEFWVFICFYRNSQKDGSSASLKVGHLMACTLLDPLRMTQRCSMVLMTSLLPNTHPQVSFPHPPKLRSSCNDTQNAKCDCFWAVICPYLSSFSLQHLRYYLMKSDTTDYSNPANFEKPLGAIWLRGSTWINLLDLGTSQGEAGRKDNDHRDQPQRSVGWGLSWTSNSSDREEPGRV